MRGPIERVEGRDTELRVLREGRLRCGADRMDRLGVEREIDGLERLEIDGLDVDRLGAERVTCRLDELRLLLRELRDDRCASAAEASNSAATTAMATATATEWDFFFVEYIKDLLSPAVCSSGNPGLPFPHYRRHPKRLVRSPSLPAETRPEYDINPIIKRT